MLPPHERLIADDLAMRVLQPLGTNNHSDMFPPHVWTESWMTEHCHRRFSVSPGFEFMKEQMGLGTDRPALH